LTSSSLPRSVAADTIRQREALVLRQSMTAAIGQLGDAARTSVGRWPPAKPMTLNTFADTRVSAAVSTTQPQTN
jgi:hypothetical protein